MSSKLNQSIDEDGHHRAIQTEIYGFAGWITTLAVYICFLMWAYLPDEVLESYGITYYPSKYWALAIPSMMVTTFTFSSIFYRAINFISTAPLDSLDTIRDEHTCELSLEDLLRQDQAPTPDIADLPLAMINELLYNKNNMYT